MGVVARSLVSTVDGQDVAAGSSDLRLHDQALGNAPGGEGAHGVVGRVELAHTDTTGNGHLAGVVHITVFRSNGGGSGLNGSTVSHGQRRTGLRVGIVRQVHVNDAVLVVINEGGDGAGFNSELSLLEEGDFTTGAQSDLADQRVANSGPFFSGADAVDEDILMLTGDGGEGQVGVLAGVALQHFVVNDHQIANGEVQADLTVVINGGNAQGIGEGAGGTTGVHADVISVQIAGVGHFCPVAGVTGGHGHHNAGVSQSFHNGLELFGGASGAAGVDGAQRQVDGVSAQNDGVFDSAQVVSITGATLLAEDLHSDQLSVGSDTLNENVIQSGNETVFRGNESVGGSNTGNVRAVLTLIVVHVGNVEACVKVVVAEGDLAVNVSLAAGDGCVQLAGELVDLSGGQQVQGSLVFIGSHTGQTCAVSQRILKGGSIKGDMVDVHTGIDDSDTGAGAGVAGSPGRGGTGLRTGGSHVGIGNTSRNHVGLIDGLDQNLFNALDGLDLVDLAVSNVSRDDIGSQSQIPDNIQIGIDSVLDLGCDLVLLFSQVAAVHLSKEVGTNSFHSVTGFQSTGLFQDDGNTDDLRVGIRRLVLRHIRGFTAGELCGNAAVANLLEADVCLSSQARDGQGQNQRDDEQHRKHFVENSRFFHVNTLLFGFSGFFAP